MGNKMKKDFERELDDIMRTGKKFAIWGAGYEGHQCLKYMDKYTNGNIAPLFFVDNNRATWKKNSVVSPVEFFQRKNEIELIFICVYVADLVEKQIREGGYTGKTVTVLNSVLYKHLVMKQYDDNKDKVEAVRKIFADKRSVDTMDAFIKVGKTGDISYFKEVNGNSDSKLIDKEILVLNDHESFVDVGAFSGDTIVEFLKVCKGKYRSIVGIEPEPGNYKILEEYLKSIDNAHPMCLACGEESGESMFFSGNSEGGGIADSGDIKVLVKRIDDIKEIEGATFIKVSALGYDYKVLMGAEELIKKNRPKIAYYCFGELMWKIPMYLKSIVPEYRLYLRHYGVGMQAMIGYAVMG